MAVGGTNLGNNNSKNDNNNNNKKKRSQKREYVYANKRNIFSLTLRDKFV